MPTICCGSTKSYLRKDRGLAENSVHVYVPFIREFLASQFTATGCMAPQAFEALSIRDFVLSQPAIGLRNMSAF